MDGKDNAIDVVREMIREQVCCLGRIFSRHDVPDDAIWEVATGFDFIYQKIKQQETNANNQNETDSYSYKLVPHPGLMHLLDKIEK